MKHRVWTLISHLAFYGLLVALGIVWAVVAVYASAIAALVALAYLMGR